MNRVLLFFAKVFIVLVLVGGISTAASAKDFYKGKTIRLIVGYSPGGGYDTYTRTVARHLSKYIPGHPTPIVQNMTGAGSLIAGNYIYNKAPRDGLTLGIFNSQFVLYQALGDRNVRLNGQKLNWIGAPVKGGPACGIMGFTGLKTLKDVLNSKKRIKMGSTRAGSTTNDLPEILNRTLGTHFEIINGYKGTSGIRIAMQKREVDGACWGWESMRVTARSMVDAKGDSKFIPFIIHNRWPDPEVRNLPLTPNVIKAKKGKEALATYKAWAVSYEFQRPFVAPPGVPADRLKILRKAYKAALEDPELLAEAKKSKLAIRYVSPEEIRQQVKQMLTLSSATKEKLAFLVRKKKKK